MTEHAIFTDVLTALLLGVIGFMFWKMKQFEGKQYVTRAEVNEIVRDKVHPLETEFEKFEIKIDNVSTQIVQIGVTLARIDERMKRDDR